MCHINSNYVFGIIYSEILPLVLAMIAAILSLATLWLSFKKKSRYQDNHLERKVRRIEYLVNENIKNQKDIQYLKNALANLEKQYVATQKKYQIIYDVVSESRSFMKGNKEDTEPKTTMGHSMLKGYTWLKVVDGGKLAIASSPDTAIYRAWESKGGLLFEFYCSKTAKAINNRASVIEPFCEVDNTMVDPDEAKDVIVKQCGKLTKDLSLVTKVLIQYK